MAQTNNKSPSQTSWSTVAFAVYLGVLAAAHIGKVPPALPQIREELSLGLGSGGLVVSMFSIVGMLAALALGITSDRIGQRASIGFGILCLMTGGLVGAYSGQFGPLLVSRAVEGFGFIAIATAMPGVVAWLASDADRPFAMGIWSSFMPVGFAAGVCLSALLLQFYDWRTVWLCLSLVVGFSGLFILRRLPEKSTGENMSLQRLWRAVAEPSIWGLAIAFGTYAFQWITVMVWLPSFLISEFDIGLLQASIATAAVVAINIPGNILGGALLGKGWRPFTLVGCSASVMIMSSAYFFSDPLGNPVLVFVSALLFSFVAGAIPATLFAAAARAPVDTRGLANGMLMQGSAVGQFAGPPLVGAVVASHGNNWSAAIVPMIMASVLMAVLVARTNSRMRKTSDSFRTQANIDG
jgi:predicted MFS family arabinose efflux permease